MTFTDGSALTDVGLIIFATGYHQFWGHIKPALGNVGELFDKVYGRAADGEYANTWRRSAQPGIWFGTGFIRMARFYTRFMALLIKAIEEGIEPTIRTPQRGHRMSARIRAIDAARRIEPGTVAILDRLTQWDLTSIETIRGSYTGAGASPAPGDPRVERSDEVIAGLNGTPGVRVRWYRPRDAAVPDASAPLPCLVWLHGGAYIMGTLDENDDRLDRMVIEAGCAVVSVDWRLAPEHPYPEGLDDAEAVWRRVRDESGAFGVDPARLAVGGASAGPAWRRRCACGSARPGSRSRPCSCSSTPCLTTVR